jgi:hypothetical protein
LPFFAQGRIVPLPGPENYLRWFSHDPAYYRKWLWLHEELVAPRSHNADGNRPVRP